MQSVVVTGVSTGIGHGIAKELLEHGFRVFGSVRKRADAKRLSTEFGANFTPLLFDITNEEAVAKAAKTVRKALKGQKLSALVNNAGIAVFGAFLDIDANKLRQQFEVNLVGQYIVTKEFIPLLGADASLQGEPGKIINIGSESGKLSKPFVGAYAMSKHALEAFTNVLRMELKMFGIDVILIGPGPVQSEIWDKGEKSVNPDELQASYYADSLLKLKDFLFAYLDKYALPAATIGKLVVNIINDPHPKVRYAPVANKSLTWILPKILPTRWHDYIFCKTLGLLPKRGP